MRAQEARCASAWYSVGQTKKVVPGNESSARPGWLSADDTLTHTQLHTGRRVESTCNFTPIYVQSALIPGTALQYLSAREVKQLVERHCGHARIFIDSLYLGTEQW